MFDPDKLSAEAREYFDGMPALMRETLVQSGMPCNTKKELESFFGRQGNKRAE